jgi:PBP1b-binding outer membrane lipoprotein LpoB
MKKIFATVFLCFVLVGCSTSYSNIDKRRDNQQAFDVDWYQCTKEAKVYVRQGMTDSSINEDIYVRRCIKARGWKRDAK